MKIISIITMTRMTTFIHSLSDFSWVNPVFFSVIFVIAIMQDLKMTVVKIGQFT